MLRDDVDVRSEDVQLLASRDALTAFFARLGYATNDRLAQSMAAMNMSGDALLSAITHIERIASQDGGFFEVYLFELHSVTVAATQSIVRSFRNRPGDYLLVLTDDYERLDFVLVERYTPQSQGQAQEAEQFAFVPVARTVSVRPRVLTVARRNPDQVALRVLRRFSNTESDTFAQYDKLISAYDVAEWSRPYFNNRALFSDYYLTERLPHDDVWTNASGAVNMTRAYRALRELYAGVRDTFANLPAEQYREQLLEPVLQMLGFALSISFRGEQVGTDLSRPRATMHPLYHADAINRSLPEGARTESIRPDYRLFASGQKVGNGGEERPLALCLAYPWNRNLDGKDEQRDPLRPDDNPGANVVTLLDSGEAGWAIVTNGKLWRLYAASAHSRATNYYEIDLEETLALPVEHLETAFRYFWLLFRAAAFLPDGFKTEGETRSVSFLAWLMGESERYARRLGERLKGRIFDEIFPHFARGFIADARRRGQLPANLEDLSQDERNRLLEPFFNGTLTFLYRLLFLLYAESRDLLPVREERGYYPHSLERLKREIASAAGTIEDEAPARLSATYSEQKTTFYDRLQTLFSAVDKGNPTLNVPVYNGGLFVTQPDPSDTSAEAIVAAFLANCKIPDRQLALGLDRMARDVDEHKHDLAFIDYKSLGVRQLGSIYEGLLEFRLRVAPETMVGVQGKKTEEIVPQSEAVRGKLKVVRERRDGKLAEKTYARGYVYLENDRRERKATGSYYTPDYIVKYIVEHTVGPVLHDKLEALRPLFREAERVLRNERDKAKALRRSDISAEHETYKKYRSSLNEAFFDLKVLDPAMGSGHFLVEAVDYITDRMADFLASFRWNPVVYELGQTRREIESAMETQGISIDAGKLTDLNLLKRQVLKRCIYGVDLNPMAVELARVSLWLDCFTLGAPLSFLDHHMKHGNSLIGGRIDEARATIEEGQLSFFGSNLWAGTLLATEGMIKVSHLSDVTEQQVRESKQRYQMASDALAPFKRILDIYISRWFGNEPVKSKHRKATVDKAIDFLRSPEAEEWYQHPERIAKLNTEQCEVVTTATQAAQQHSFFHWELEFPEVFFAPAPGTTQAIQSKANPGFDAVVGNPPYVDLKGMDSILVNFYFKAFSTAENRLNIFAFFEERGIGLVCDEYGAVGFIIPTVLLVQESYKKIREIILNKTAIQSIVRLPSESFGESAGQVKVDTMILCLKRGYRAKSLTDVLIYSGFNRIENISAETANLHQRILQSNWFDNLASVISLSTGTKEEGILQKIKGIGVDLENLCDFCLGLTPYDKYAGHTDKQIQNRVFHSNRCLSETYKPLLRSGDVDRYFVEWNGEEWINYGSWLAAPRDPRFFREKHILVNQIVDWTTRRIKSGITHEELYNTQNAFNLLPLQNISLAFVVSLLNSSLMNFAHEKLFLDEEKMRFQKILIKDARKLPIRRITFTLTPEQRAAYLVEARTLYAAYLETGDGGDMLAFVGHHLGQQPEQSDVVHDLLAYLAEEMIRLNKEKRAGVKQFLGWLETTLKIVPDREGRIGIESLTGKSKLLDYPGDYQKGESPLAFAELLDILRKNQRHFAISLNDMVLVERVRQRYEGSLAMVLPLKDRLARTDALIDGVVYKLYGLTEEEVRVVEGRG